MDSGERNESCPHDYHQSSERILAEPVDRTSNLLFSSPVHYQLRYGSWCIRDKGAPIYAGVLLTSTPHSILPKSLAAVPHYHHRKSEQWWEMNESCPNDYHQSSEIILAKPVD